jgi:hypothetical protein
MNNKINQVIEAAIQKPRAQAVKEAMSKLLGESFKAGEEVAVVDDDLTVGGYVGKAKVVSQGVDGGMVEVEWPDGTRVFTQSSLLLKV